MWYNMREECNVLVVMNKICKNDKCYEKCQLLKIINVMKMMNVMKNNKHCAKSMQNDYCEKGYYEY